LSIFWPFLYEKSPRETDFSIDHSENLAEIAEKVAQNVSKAKKMTENRKNSAKRGKSFA
jgi:hypothetical protein